MNHILDEFLLVKFVGSCSLSSSAPDGWRMTTALAGNYRDDIRRSRNERWSMHTSWTTPQFDDRTLLFLDNSGLSWTVSAPDKVTAVPVRWNGNFQTPISVPAVRPKRCHSLSNPAHRQNYTVACLNYTLQTMMPLPGWPVMAPNAYNNSNNGMKAKLL